MRILFAAGLCCVSSVAFALPADRTVPGLEKVCGDYYELNPEEDAVATAATFLQDQAVLETKDAAAAFGLNLDPANSSVTVSGGSVLFHAEATTTLTNSSFVIVPNGPKVVALGDQEVQLVEGDRILVTTSLADKLITVKVEVRQTTGDKKVLETSWEHGCGEIGCTLAGTRVGPTDGGVAVTPVIYPKFGDLIMYKDPKYINFYE